MASAPHDSIFLTTPETSHSKDDTTTPSAPSNTTGKLQRWSLWWHCRQHQGNPSIHRTQPQSNSTSTLRRSVAGVPPSAGPGSAPLGQPSFKVPQWSNAGVDLPPYLTQHNDSMFEHVSQHVEGSPTPVTSRDARLRRASFSKASKLASHVTAAGTVPMDPRCTDNFHSQGDDDDMVSHYLNWTDGAVHCSNVGLTAVPPLPPNALYM